MADVGTLEDAAKKRKERLLALKQKRSAPEDGSVGDEPPEKLPKPIFRSYKPKDEGLKENQLPQIKPAELETQVQDQLNSAKPEPTVEEVDLVNLAPRKPDWDLKRDVAKKLDKLERRTQRAIAELIRDRLEAGNEDLAAVVNSLPDQPDDEG